MLEEEFNTGSLSNLEDSPFLENEPAQSKNNNQQAKTVSIETAKAGDHLNDGQKKQLRDQDDEEDFLDECERI